MGLLQKHFDAMPLMQFFIAECTYSAILILAICLSCKDEPYVRSVTYGLTLLFGLHVFGSITGTMTNPSVTLAYMIMGYLNRTTAVLLIFAQLVGSLLGAAIFHYALSPENTDSICLPIANIDDVDWSENLLLLEFAVTMAYIAIWHHMYKLSITLGVMAQILQLVGASVCYICINYTGCIANPMLVIGPAIITGDYQKAPHYIGVHILAALLYPYAVKTIEAYYDRKTVSYASPAKPCNSPRRMHRRH